MLSWFVYVSKILKVLHLFTLNFDPMYKPGSKNCFLIYRVNFFWLFFNSVTTACHSDYISLLINKIEVSL